MLVLPSKSAVVWDKFLTENKVLVYKYIVREIKRCLYDDEEKIYLFKFEDNTMFAWVPKDKALQTLEDALGIFVKEEEYEYAQKTKSVIDKYHVYKLIKESNKTED
jgi:hypothetical protein